MYHISTYSYKNPRNVYPITDYCEFLLLCLCVSCLYVNAYYCVINYRIKLHYWLWYNYYFSMYYYIFKINLSLLRVSTYFKSFFNFPFSANIFSESKIYIIQYAWYLYTFYEKIPFLFKILCSWSLASRQPWKVQYIGWDYTDVHIIIVYGLYSRKLWCWYFPLVIAHHSSVIYTTIVVNYFFFFVRIPYHHPIRNKS